MFKELLRDKKLNHSAIHELALCYKKSGRLKELRDLLAENQALVSDSAMFADFQIGVDLARGDVDAAERGIMRLRALPNDDGRSDIRAAQLLMRRHHYQEAKEDLTRVLKHSHGNTFRVRSLRAMCAARAGDFDLVREDIDFVKSSPAWQDAAIRLEANLLIEQKRPAEARASLSQLPTKSPEDWLLFAHALDVEADLPQTSVADRELWKREAAEIRLKHNFALEYDFSE